MQEKPYVTEDRRDVWILHSDSCNGLLTWINRQRLLMEVNLLQTLGLFHGPVFV